MVTLLHNCILSIFSVKRLIVEVRKLPFDDIVHMNLVPDYKRVNKVKHPNDLEINLIFHLLE